VQIILAKMWKREDSPDAAEQIIIHEVNLQKNLALIQRADNMLQIISLKVYALESMMRVAPSPIIGGRR
jgi:hypothetical protein